MNQRKRDRLARADVGQEGGRVEGSGPVGDDTAAHEVGSTCDALLNQRMYLGTGT